jgi:hypothetical protein
MRFPDDAGAVVGSFCQWRRDATGAGAPMGTCGETRIESRPWAREVTVDTVDGEGSVPICTLATTTCPALLHLGVSRTGCQGEPGPGVGSDDACGAPGLADGRCAIDEATNQLACSYPCRDSSDCGSHCNYDNYCVW